MNTSEQAPPAPPTVWGDTCPILKIANHYGIDYTAALYAADYFIHRRMWPIYANRLINEVPVAVWVVVCEDIMAYVHRFKALQQGYAR